MVTPKSCWNNRSKLQRNTSSAA